MYLLLNSYKAAMSCTGQAELGPDLRGDREPESGALKTLDSETPQCWLQCQADYLVTHA